MPPQRGRRAIEKVSRKSQQEDMETRSGPPVWLWVVAVGAVLCLVVIVGAMLWPRSGGGPATEEDKQRQREQMMQGLEALKKKK